MDDKLNFEIADFNDNIDLVLNRSSADEQSQEWSLISVNGSIDISRLLLGSFIINSRDGKDFTLQYKITNKYGNLSSGFRDMMFKPIPDEFKLSQAYPNPFNPRTTIEYALPIEADLLLSIYDIQGRLVTYLVQGLESAGYHKAVWDGSQYASGLYFIRMESYGLGNALKFNQIQKIMLIK